MTTTVEQQLLTTEDLSQMLGHSADWWARRARAKKIPHARIGKKIRFTADHVAQIVAAHEVQPESGPAKPTTPASPAPSTPMGLTPRSAAAARRRAGKAVA